MAFAKKKTLPEAPAEPSPRHLPRQKPYQKHKPSAGEPTRREEVPVGGVSMARFLFSCVGGLTDTKSGTPNIHIKHSAAEGILTPEGAQASRATGFDP